MQDLSTIKEPHFIPDKIYKRSTIHDLYGGNRQWGISYSKEFPYIFIFSSKAGHQHGYKDQWENEDVYSYTGHGQEGDMKFVTGNLQLKDHIASGKRVFLFTEAYRSHFKFESEVELLDIDFFIGKDKIGKERTAIKFFFKRIGKQLKYPVEQLSLTNAAEDQAPYNDVPDKTERKGLVTSRVGQGAYRKSILFRWEFKCAITNYTKKEILIASHIVPWKDSSNDERLDVDNGILLSPNFDALFDQHLISFENNGKIILSENLQKSNYDLIGVTGKESIKKLSSGNIYYLERHRENLQ